MCIRDSGDRLAGPVLVNRADLELFVAAPKLHTRHRATPWSGCRRDREGNGAPTPTILRPLSKSAAPTRGRHPLSAAEPVADRDRAQRGAVGPETCPC